MIRTTMRYALRGILFLSLTLVLAVAILIGLALWKSRSMHGFVLAAAFGIVLTICVTVWRTMNARLTPRVDEKR
jgi:hypothetical protein